MSAIVKHFLLTRLICSNRRNVYNLYPSVIYILIVLECIEQQYSFFKIY